MPPYRLPTSMRANGDTVPVPVFTLGGTGAPVIRLYRHITGAGLETCFVTTMIQLNVLELLILCHLCSTLRARTRVFVYL